MKNMKKAVVAILIITVLVFALAACDTKDDVTYYQETVVGKYGDGINLVGIVTPAVAPTQYTDLPRVEKSVYFDTRLEGWHFTGVYVVEGEEITLTFPKDKADGTITATVGRYLSQPFSISLDADKVTFTSPVSGLLDIDLGHCFGDAYWQMSVSGGVSASYFRLGLDRTADWKDSVGYAVVDATNARIYLPARYLDSASDVEKAAAWWRSLCEYVDKYVIGDFAADKLTPTDIFVTADATSLYYDTVKDILYVPVDMAERMLDYDSLSGGGIWDIMLAFTEGKTLYAGMGAAESAQVSGIIAAGAFVKLTDSILSAESGEEYWINNAYSCLQLSLEGLLTGYGDLAAYVNLIHSFGEEKVVSTAVAYALPAKQDTTSENGQDAGASQSAEGTESGAVSADNVTVAQYFCNEFAKDGADLSDYFINVCGIDVTAPAKEGLTRYIPVQSAFAVGNGAPADKTGVTVNSGETTSFDFSQAVISSASAVELKKVTLGDGEWKANDDGLYYYKPADNTKSQNFTLEYGVDGQSVTLSGRFTCNIAVSVFSRYENVPWRDMKTAVKEYEESSEYLADTHAVSKAEVPQNSEVDDGVYTFSVNKGVIQVDETATYVIYVRSKGMTRVDFGVPKYMFTMFENTLTVNEYTDLLCYEIELQQGVSYYYDIYILATKGNAYACLGISKKGETDIKDLDDSYLVYYPFDKQDVSGYQAPSLIPYSFGVSMEGRTPYEDLGATVTEYPAADNGSQISAAVDGNDDTSFTSKESTSHTYVFAFKESFRAEYLLIKTGVTGVKYELSYGTDGQEYTLCSEGELNKNIDVRFEKAVRVKYVRLTLSSDTPFKSVIKDVYCGVYSKEATIVPSNSSRVLYQGKWQYKTGGISVNGWILESYGDDAAIEFNFYGTGISVYCAKGDVYGSMQIYVDGKQYGAVDLNSATTLYDCNVFSVDFSEPGKHKIRIVPSSNDDIINLDYFTVVYAEQEESAPEVGNLWYFAIIPAALIVIFAVCAALDIADRRNKRRKQTAKAGGIEKAAEEKEEDKEDGEKG